MRRIEGLVSIGNSADASVGLLGCEGRDNQGCEQG